MNDERIHSDAATIRVAAAVTEVDLPICSEVMNALPDPADPDQAMLVNVPVLVDEINYGDIVRLGDEDDCGVRPITDVVVASGHVHMLVAADDGGASDLIAELERTFPAYALRIAAANDTLISLSIHPDLDPGEVAAVIACWLGVDAEDADEGPAIGPLCETELGRLAVAG